MKGDKEMKEFDWEKLKRGFIVVHCKTNKEAKNFLKLCDKNNIRYRTGYRTIKRTNFNEYEVNTAYEYDIINMGLCYENVDYYSKLNYLS